LCEDNKFGCDRHTEGKLLEDNTCVPQKLWLSAHPFLLALTYSDVCVPPHLENTFSLPCLYNWLA